MIRAHNMTANMVDSVMRHLVEEDTNVNVFLVTPEEDVKK